MTKQVLAQPSVDERTLMRATARLRARVMAILHAAQERSGQNQVMLAKELGIRKSAVHQVLRGNGNLQVDTLGEYLAAMGLEADIVVAECGEFSSARQERRAPRLVVLTLADQDRQLSGNQTIIIDSSRTRQNMSSVSAPPMDKSVMSWL